MIPIVASTFGVLNEADVSYLGAVATSAALNGKPLCSEPAGPASLCQLVQFVFILEVAQIVVWACSQESEPVFVQEIVVRTAI